MQSKCVPCPRVLFDNGQNVALSLRQAHGMVGGGGFAGFALSLVCGWVGGRFLGSGDDCWRRLAVGGGGGHGSGGGCLRRRVSGGTEWAG